MTINWKEVAASTGYQSMKAAVANEKARAHARGSKPDKRYEQAFNFAINRAKHYAHYIGCDLQDVLNDWEEARDYNFMSYYANHHFPRFEEKTRKLTGVKGQIKNIKNIYHGDPKSKAKRILSLLVGQQKTASKKTKPRWSMARKKRGY